MTKLFYSKEEKTLFWVVGYADNIQHVNDIISVLSNQRDYFKSMGAIGAIKTDVITSSRRYKYMRYFWCDNMEEKDVPEEAFKISNNWTMLKWLED